jgi:hypothetical protein
MHTGTGKIIEISLDGARIECPPNLIPAPGQVLLAHADRSSAPIACPVFSSGSTADGFIAAPPIPSEWIPGTPLYLRGPLGRGFDLPRAARKIALIALDDHPLRLMGMIRLALAQGAMISLACDHPPREIPLAVEIVPSSSAHELIAWADMIAVDVQRAAIEKLSALKLPSHAQVLIAAPMPCGGIAECGVCAVNGKLACKDGPVIAIHEVHEGTRK